MDNLRRLGDKISINIPPDEDGFTGRECPATECEAYFKVQFGTGLKGDNVPCHCPYCGYTRPHDEFWTQEQIEYAKSQAIRQISDAVRRDFKKLEFDIKPRGSFGIGLSLKLEDGRPYPIHYFREKRLETIVICDKCTLRYAIYGVFGYCPDCGVHNSLQIFVKSLELIEKQLKLASSVENELSNQLIEDAIENAVSAFDGFGREICRINAKKCGSPANARSISFQSIEKARKRIIGLFSYDIASPVSPDEWNIVCCCFQKRHLLAHKMGVIDKAYIDATGDKTAISGRRIDIQSAEVEMLATCLEKIATGLSLKLK